jgi:hypothetical protein
MNFDAEAKVLIGERLIGTPGKIRTYDLLLRWNQPPTTQLARRWSSPDEGTDLPAVGASRSSSRGRGYTAALASLAV